jgi:adenosine deaminase CECR1
MRELSSCPPKSVPTVLQVATRTRKYAIPCLLVGTCLSLSIYCAACWDKITLDVQILTYISRSPSNNVYSAIPLGTPTVARPRGFDLAGISLFTFLAAIIVPMRKRLMLKRKKRGKTPKEEPFVTDVKMVDAIPNHVVQDPKDAFVRNLQNGSPDVYESSKKLLLREESDIAWDRPARIAASEAEREAGAIIWQIREDERDNLFGNKASESIPGPETLDMGGQFLTNRSRIQTSRVYDIAHAMPKGCHLHLHLNAEITPEKLIAKAREIPNMFIRSTQPLVEDKDYSDTEMVFNVMPEDTVSVDIFHPEYRPDWRSAGATPWMRWSKFRQELQAKKGIEAEDWVLGKMILSEEEVYGISQTTNG